MPVTNDGRASRRSRLAALGWRRLLAAAITGAVVISGAVVTSAPAQAAGADPVSITVDGADVAAAAENVNGLTFKGFGVLSANSTSSLLMDYKAEQPEKYWELIETLFGGANPIMNTVKIEMGNDRNTSTGPDAATMRSRDEYPNVEREPGFQLAADAQSVAQGEVHVSLLRWNRPTWVTSDEDQYIWFKNTILAAYREYGIMVDSVNPDANETSSPNTSLYEEFTSWVENDTTGYDGATTDDPNNGFASDEEKTLFQSIETVAGDTVGTPSVSFGDALTASDSTLRDSVDIVGFHYSSADDSNGNMKELADVYDKEIWNSEGQATFSNSADRPNNTNSNGASGTGTEFGGTNGALEMANWITTGFANSRRTLSIFQPAIGSFYDGFQYSSKELVSARDPWSGWIYYDGGLAVLEQFTQFATLGWENDDNTAGIWRAIPEASGSALGTGNPPSGAAAGNASYTTLAAPDGSDFSTVIVNDSSYTKTYNITATDLNLGSDDTMELWETRAADSGEAYDANYVTPYDEITPDADGTYTVTVKPYSIATATTLDHAVAGGDGTLTARDGYGNQLPTSAEYTSEDGGRDVLDTDATGAVNGVTDDGYLYADDFDYAEEGDIQTYDPETGTLSDSGESYLDSRGSEAKPDGTPSVDAEDDGATPRYTNDTNGAFESVATDDSDHDRVLRQQVGAGMAGSAWNSGDPKTTIGDSRWANYKVSTDVKFEDATSAYASVGAREQGGTANGQSVSAAELKVTPTGAWTFMRYGATLASGTVSAADDTAFQTGADVWNNLAVQVAGDVYTAYINGVEVASYTDPTPQATGRIQLGSAFTFTDFDNLKVETVPGYTPYYSTVIDGMHQTSWADTSTPVLQFDSSWSHVNGQGMYEWQRTASTSTAQGASMSYTFTGTGLDVIGTNTGSATLDVTVDGTQIVTDASTYAAGSEKTTYMLRGLSNAEHTVTIQTANSSAINVDAVGVVVANADSSAVDTTALATAVAAATGLSEDEYKADSWAVFAAALAAAQSALDDPVAYGLDAEGAAALVDRLTAAQDALMPVDISSDVTDLGLVALTSGSALPASVTIDGADADVVWDGGAAASLAATTDLGTVTLTGRTAEKLDSGVYQRFSVTLLVVPADLTYFIDSGSSGAADGSAYAAVDALYPSLLNDSADQTWDGSSTDKTWGYATTSTTAAAGDPADWGSSYLGVDYTKPITYSLTLPAGSYNIVTVQAPRSGYTTNISSTVTVDGTSTKVTGTSTGAATSLTQAVTLDEDGVAQVVFGTNGTSGYNGRLALVYVQAVAQDLGVQGALTVDEALPDTVSVDGVDTPVVWDDATTAATRTAYGTLTATGWLDSADSGKPVTADYEIIPSDLVYYIDSGTSGVASPQYSAVAAAVPGLLNDAVDQVSADDDTWGYVSDGMKVKSSTDINDKYSTGYYQDTTQLIYRLPLPAGTYTLTAGFTEWWNLSRTMNATVSVDGEELAKGNIALSGTATPLTGDLTFTLTDAATVTYLVTNEGAGSQKPVISWLAVAQDADTSALQAAVDAASALTESDYTASSWATLVTASTDAQAVLDDDDPSIADVASATAALVDAQASLVSLVVLQAAADAAAALDEADYSADSWAPFAEALTRALSVLADPDAQSADVTAATDALVAAQQQLAVDTTALQAAADAASALTEADYTVGSWQDLTAALTQAQAVLDDPDATADAVSAAVTELLAAQQALVDVAALRAAADGAALLDESDYTADSWSTLADALADAQTVLADEDATATEVSAALTALTSALDGLAAPVDTSVLDARIAEATGLAAGDYTAETWSALAQALATAVAVRDDPASTQEQMDAAAAALAQAEAGLALAAGDPEAADRTALQAAVDSATPLAESDYSSDSWATFAAALAQAQELLADDSATQAQIDAARAALISAQGALVAVDDADATTDATDGAGDADLAATGADIAGPLAAGLLLAVLGVLVVVVRRRPRH
ncbi:MAG: DUF1080 domain-containing protein [Microbacterium sp.]|uniref:family 16 glycoside hydrolase n=1 Tax=Microbacterium sp. TaxID=51671 RepID=UPI0039E4F5D4